jgi:diacylglycerol kinase
MKPPFDPRRGSWIGKFRCAGRGVMGALRAQRSSFAVHLVVAAAVVVAAIVLGVSLIEWCVLILCVAAVMIAELFNTALEHLARAVTREHNEEIRDALDTSSGAVLLVAIGAAIAGSLIFMHRLGVVLAWWSH